jgi:hypothetical protein
VNSEVVRIGSRIKSVKLIIILVCTRYRFRTDLDQVRNTNMCTYVDYETSEMAVLVSALRIQVPNIHTNIYLQIPLCTYNLGTLLSFRYEGTYVCTYTQGTEKCPF